MIVGLIGDLQLAIRINEQWLIHKPITESSIEQS
jgi:hypothetical protein